jgi:hypothetical protein
LVDGRGPIEDISRSKNSLDFPRIPFIDAYLLTDPDHLDDLLLTDKSIPWLPFLSHPPKQTGYEKTVFIKISESAMEPVIQAGSLVAIDRTKHEIDFYRSNDLVAIKIRNSVFIRRCFENSDHQYFLCPDNGDKRETYCFNKDEMAERIVGRVVGIWKNAQ